MKKSNLKILAALLLLAIAMPFLLTACGEGESNEPASDSTNTTAEETGTTEAPTTTAEPTTPEPTEPPTTLPVTEPPTDPAALGEPDANGIILGARYYLWSPNSNYYLTVDKESKYTGFTQDVFTGAPNQMYVFEDGGDGRYKIRALGTIARYLDTEFGDGTRDGAVLEATETPYADDSQLWTLQKQGTVAGYESFPTMSIMSVISGSTKCVDVADVSVDPGHFIHMWAGGTANNQKWVFELVSEVESGAITAHGKTVE
jgi:hypothetical protein